MTNRLNLVLSVAIGGLAIHGAIVACGSVRPQTVDAQANDGSTSSDVPAGTIVSFAGSTAPTGWMLCDGAAVSRTTYATLFSAIAINFGGGDGVNTFNLPDLRGRTTFGAGQGAGLTNRLIGQTFGEESHTLTLAEIPKHRHLVPNLTQRVGLRTGTGGAAEKNDGDFNTEFTDYQGGDQAHNNMPPGISLTTIIKY
jgi:microcystin-dependent protein